MAKLAPAAQQLVIEVQSISPAAKAYPIGPRDQHARLLAVQFDPTTSRWLAPILDIVIANDQRIDYVDCSHPKLIVTFVRDHTANLNNPFSIATVGRLLQPHARWSRTR
jgi:hypothetical protein